jgi:hypothetical protein
MSSGGNLTSQGVALCNTFTHVLKSFYDFADTLYDANDREKMIALIRTHEGAAAAYIAAMRTGVKS